MSIFSPHSSHITALFNVFCATELKSQLLSPEFINTTGTCSVIDKVSAIGLCVFTGEPCFKSETLIVVLHFGHLTLFLLGSLMTIFSLHSSHMTVSFVDKTGTMSVNDESLELSVMLSMLSKFNFLFPNTFLIFFGLPLPFGVSQL